MPNEFDKLYKDYANTVKRFLISLTGSLDLSEELMQETFYQAIMSIDRYNGECKMSVWLCQIAKHRYYDYLKKQKHYRSNFSEGDISDMTAIPSKGDSIENEVIKRDEVKYLLKCVEEIYEPYGKVFMLRIYGELSYHEIGRIFGKSESWARVTYYRAKEKLKRKADLYENNL